MSNEKFQIVESTEEGLSHSAANLPFNRSERIDNLIHWIYSNAPLLNGESIEHDLEKRTISVYVRNPDGTKTDILKGCFCVPTPECCNGQRCCQSTN